MVSTFYKFNLRQQKDYLITETYKNNFFFLSTVASIKYRFIQVSFLSMSFNQRSQHHQEHINISFIQKVEQLNAQPVQNVKKCPVYLHVSCIGTVSTRFEK